MNFYLNFKLKRADPLIAYTKSPNTRGLTIILVLIIYYRIIVTEAPHLNTI